MNYDFVRWTTPEGGETEYTFYYDCPGGECHLLPIGAEFTLVSSPSLVCRPDRRRWNKTRFRVVESREQHGASAGKLGRFYRPVKQRDLTADEIAAYVGIISEMRVGEAV